MNTRAIRSALVNTLGVALALASGSALAISYRLTDLGTLGGPLSEGRAINASGQVTGAASLRREAGGTMFRNLTASGVLAALTLVARRDQ